MDTLKVWASEIEIIAVAKMLQRSIFVYATCPDYYFFLLRATNIKTAAEQTTLMYIMLYI